MSCSEREVIQSKVVQDAVVCPSCGAADQVELVDMSPQALRRRLAHGNVYAAEKVDAALTNYFRVGNLTALRVLALLWVAGVWLIGRAGKGLPWHEGGTAPDGQAEPRGHRQGHRRGGELRHDGRYTRRYRRSAG